MILERDLIRVVIEEKENCTSEKIEIKDGDKWVAIIGSNVDHCTLNSWLKNEINSKTLNFQKRTNKKLYYQLNDNDFAINLDYCLEENNIIDIKYKISNNRKIHLSKLGVNYAILLGNEPDYTWVPHLRPNENLVMGDHIFRSPAIIYKKGNYAFAFIPDLKTLGLNRPFQTFMDLNLKPMNFKGTPQVFYGFGNYKPVGHIRFKHKPNKKWKIKANTDLTFRYNLIIFIDKPVQEILEFVNNFFWEKYGRKLFYESLNPQILPYDFNVKEGVKALFEKHKVWGDLKINGKDCGGFWQSSWLGKKKKPIHFFNSETFDLETHQKKSLTRLFGEESLLSRIIMYFSNSPFWIKRFAKFTQNHGIINRNAEIWNQAWFMNMRSGYGLKYFGEFWGDKDLIEKGDRILNTLLYIPRIKGIFPNMILPSSLGGSNFSSIKSVTGFIIRDQYSTVDCSLSMYWALKYYKDFEKNELVIEKSIDLLELLKELQLENGEIPNYLNFDSKNNNPIISDLLINSASSGASLMFLIELYKLIKDNNIIPIVEKIANYIKTEIIPEDKWHDFEPFYSCTHLPVDFYDDYTKKHVMNCLCIYWCAEGMKELYRITNKKEYLKLGERILAILSLFQQVWNMPYISFNTFGGFCSQNIDAELSDARQALFIRVYMEYYLETGKKEYMERGIAALRACWAMQLLREYQEQCPGNLRGIKTVDGIDRGCVTENYGHSGTDLWTPGYIMFDWGFGTSASATAYTKKHFGDLFIDFKEKLAWGIDGIIAKSFDFKDNSVNISIEMLPNKDYIIVKARHSPENACEIIINDNSIGLKEKEDLNSGFIYKIE